MERNEGARIGYEYTHALLKKKRGRAAEFKCSDCENQAAHWSLSAYAEEILIEDRTSDKGKAYSHDLNDYEPRCRKCHYAYDKKHGLMRGPDGNRSGRTRTSLMNRKGCSVEGCENTHKARGLCMNHYAQALRKEKSMKQYDSLEQMAVEQTMDFMWNACMTGADLDRVLASLEYKCRKLRKELKDEANG